MICCQSFIPPTTAQPQSDSLSVSRDPVWKSIQAEASRAAESEPLLRQQLECCVLQQASLGDSIATLLAGKLHDAFVDRQALREQLREVLQQEQIIEQSIRDDLLAIRERDPASDHLLFPLLNFKGLHALETYRLANVLWRSSRRPLALYLQGRASEVFGVDIHPAATIGQRVMLDHASGIVIGETAVVGNGVTILHGVTLGSTGKDDGDRHPKVGDRVFIGADAQLLGNIQVGDDAKIAAGSVLLENVDPGVTVAGIPARTVRRNDLSIAAQAS